MILILMVCTTCMRVLYSKEFGKFEDFGYSLEKSSSLLQTCEGKKVLMHKCMYFASKSQHAAAILSYLQHPLLRIMGVAAWMEDSPGGFHAQKEEEDEEEDCHDGLSGGFYLQKGRRKTAPHKIFATSALRGRREANGQGFS